MCSNCKKSWTTGVVFPGGEALCVYCHLCRFLFEATSAEKIAWTWGAKPNPKPRLRHEA